MKRATIPFLLLLLATTASAQSAPADTCRREATAFTPYGKCEWVESPGERLLAVEINGQDTTWTTISTGRRERQRMKARYATTRNANPNCAEDARILIQYKACR